MKKNTIRVMPLCVAALAMAFSANAQLKNRSVWKTAPTTTTQAPTPGPVQEETVPEEDTSSAIRVNEVVVTATRSEKNASESGRSVTVISSEDIKNSGANTVAELLNTAEGIYVTGAGQNFGANQSLFMRGANSNQSVVMIDGIAISDPSTPTGALDLSELSLSAIDHIEVVRGSHSTLYGSSAIGGVVNIITTNKMKEGLNITASGTGGVFGSETSLIGQNIGMNYTWKNGLYANMDFNNSVAEGIDATVDTLDGMGIPRDQDGLDHFAFGGKAGYKTNRWDVSIWGRKTERNARIDDREFQDDNNYLLDFERTMVNYQASRMLDTGLTVTLKGGSSSMIRNAFDDSSVVDNMGNYDHTYYTAKYTGSTSTNEIQLHYKKEKFSLLLGGGSTEQMMNQQVQTYFSGFWYITDLDTLDIVSRTGSFFLLAELNGKLFSEKAKNFSVSLGARSNNNNTFGSSLTWQFSPQLKISSHSSLYGNISSGYNAPSLYQLHAPDKDFTSFITRGNVNLRPETSVTREFGLYQKVNDHTGIRMGFFKTEVDDLIEYVYLWDKNVNVNSVSWSEYRGDTYLNLGKMTTEGIEVDAYGSISKKMRLEGNFSWLRGKYDFYPDKIDTVKTEGNHVQIYSNGQFVPAHKLRTYGLTRRPVTANMAFTWMPGKKVFYKGVIKYVSKRNDVYYDGSLGPFGALGNTSVKAYMLVDLLAGVKFNNNLSGLVRIENLFDEEYSEIRGYASRGRGLFLSVNYTF